MPRSAAVALLALAFWLVFGLGACAPPPASREALDVARGLAASGLLDEAQARLADLDAAHPQDARVARLAGDVATWRGRPSEALIWMRRAAERAPGDPDAHLAAAYVLLVHPPEGEPDVVAALAQAAAALADAGGVEGPDYRAARGEAAWATGDIADAERWFRAALELRSDCRWALHRLLQIVSARGVAADPERQELNERLSELLRKSRTGEGMEPARMPVAFCCH